MPWFCVRLCSNFHVRAERYLFYWYLMQDGRIEFEIKLSGELSTNLLSEGESKPEHGVLVAPGVNAQLHQVLLGLPREGPLLFLLLVLSS